MNLEEIPNLGSNRSRELIALDDALNTLAEMDPRKARVIELRFFGGLSVEETAEVLKISVDTVFRGLETGTGLALGRVGQQRCSKEKVAR